MLVVPGLSINYVTDSAQAIESAFSAFIDDYTVHFFDVRDDVPGTCRKISYCIFF